MKKSVGYVFLTLLLTLLFYSFVFADDDSWMSKSFFTDVYEFAKEKIYLQWNGDADLYQIYIDGENVSTVNLKYAVVDVKAGAHQIVVIPTKYVPKDADTNLSLNLEAAQTVGFGGSIDLKALGWDKKDLVQGIASDIFKINYNVSPILNASPEIIDASTDFDNRVLLSFTDKYESNKYIITIKNGKDINYIEFDSSSEEASSFISKNNSTVEIIFDQNYLKKHECMVPELGEKYSFTVKLQKYPVDQIDGEKEKSSVLESKESKSFEYTPYAAWKNAPVITYASQTADGQVTLQWDHDDNGLGCKYKVIKHDSIMGIKRNVEEIAVIAERKLVIEDLMNGKYNYAVIPVYGDEEGVTSESVTAEVNNNWVAAPSLECEKGNGNQVLLKWNSPEEIESYHVTVSVGSGSLLRFVKLDYKKYEEFDVPAAAGDMEYTYKFDPDAGTESGIELKFEIYGIRHAADGTEQKSASTTKTISIDY